MMINFCGILLFLNTLLSYNPDSTAISNNSSGLLEEESSIQTIVIHGVAQPSDQYSYRLEEFIVPDGIGAMEIEFDYTGRHIHSEIEIGLFDPDGFRGTSRFSKSSFIVSKYRTTPSYFPGPVSAGTWHISLGFPTVRAESEYEILIRLIPENHPEFYGPLNDPLRDEPDWYHGDFHTHTGHSDAFGCHDTEGRRSPCQTYQVAEASHRNQLDFVAINDHNTVSHHQDIIGIQPTFPNLLLIRGQEVTTFYGHANVMGTSMPIDFRIGYGGRTITDIQKESKTYGSLFVINHPGRETGPSCTGCGWSAEDTDYTMVDAVEIVNGTNVETEISGIPFWHDLLNQGYRITAIGGSDDHGADFGRSQPGTPTTVVWAENLSEQAIIDGVKSGKVYLKTERASDPDIAFYATSGNQTWDMGGTILLEENLNESILFHLITSPQDNLTVEWILNGVTVQLQETAPLDEEGEMHFSYALEQPVSGWLRVNLRRDNRITTISNPVYMK